MQLIIRLIFTIIFDKCILFPNINLDFNFLSNKFDDSFSHKSKKTF